MPFEIINFVIDRIHPKGFFFIVGNRQADSRQGSGIGKYHLISVSIAFSLRQDSFLAGIIHCQSIIRKILLYLVRSLWIYRSYRYRIPQAFRGEKRVSLALPRITFTSTINKVRRAVVEIIFLQDIRITDVFVYTTMVVGVKFSSLFPAIGLSTTITWFSRRKATDEPSLSIEPTAKSGFRYRMISSRFSV